MAVLIVIKFLHKLIRSVRSSSAIEESWDLVARGKNKEAEEMFINATKHISKLNFELEIINGFIKFRLEKRLECLDAFERAWHAIDIAEKLSQYDKNYLKYYIYGIAKVYYQYLDIGERKKLGPVEASDVFIAKVSPRWKRRFPNRDHPDWPR